MSYAVRNDGLGWRAVDGPDDVGPDETYSDAQPVLNPPPVALTADEVRAQRDRLLAQSDWTQLSDVSKAISTAWAPYRQALRDVPGQKGFPENIEWPAAPAAK